MKSRSTFSFRTLFCKLTSSNRSRWLMSQRFSSTTKQESEHLTIWDTSWIVEPSLLNPTKTETFNGLLVKGDLPKHFKALWTRANSRVVSASAANELFRLFTIDEDPSPLLPDLIKGDLSKIDQNVKSYYKEQNTIISDATDHNMIDLEKCLQTLTNPTRFALKKINHKLPLLIFGGLGGNLSEILANLNAVSKTQHEQQHYLVSQTQIGMILPKGSHRIKTNQTKTRISIFPFGSPSYISDCSGFNYNLNNTQLDVNSLVSYANESLEKELSLTTDHKLLFLITQ